MTSLIHIYAMRTWGELGNLLAAKTLGGVLASQIPEARVQVFEAEMFLPRFLEAGEAIKNITLTSSTAAERRTRYLAFMESLEAVFHAGFEDAPDAFWQQELRDWTAHLETTQPDVVIGTKGVISRVLLAAVAITGQRRAVLNFITNHGLLLLSIHRSTHMPLHLVQFEEGMEWLTRRYGCDASTVELVGPMVAGHVLAQELVKPSADGGVSDFGEQFASDMPRLVIFCNRGGQEYLALMQSIAERHPGTELMLIAYNNPTMLEEAARIRAAGGQYQWRLFDRLSQSTYLHEISALSRSRYPLIITKTGPNTALEAAFFGVPSVLLDSGLPMEEWVMGWMERHGLGRAARDGTELTALVDEWLAEPRRIAECRERVAAFRREYLDEVPSGTRIARPVRAALQTTATPTGAAS